MLQYLQRLSLALKYFFMTEFLAIISTMFTRISICIFLLRIFSTKQHWRWGLYTFLVFVTVTQTSAAVLVLVQCQPVQRLWNPTIPGKCWNPHVQIRVGDFNGAISAFCDWVLATLPIVFLWNIQMSSRIKAGICCLMGMGFFSGLCAIVRTVYLQKLASTDITWQGVDLVIWATLEEKLGIIAACMPTLKPLFHQMRHGSLRSRLLRWRYYHRERPEEGKSGPDLRLTPLPPAKGPYSRIGDRNYTEVSIDAPQARLQRPTDGISKTTVVSLKQQRQDPNQDPNDGFVGRSPVRMTV